MSGRVMSNLVVSRLVALPTNRAFAPNLSGYFALLFAKVEATLFLLFDFLTQEITKQMGFNPVIDRTVALFGLRFNQFPYVI